MSDGKAYSLAGTAQEVGFIVDVLALPPGARILDLYCGYGRHALELAKRGYRVVGMDANTAFIDIAKRSAAEEGVWAEFVHGDMRDLAFTGEFDAIINMFAAFGYFDDAENARIVKQVAAALKPSGRFLIDLLNRDWMVHNSLNRYWRHPSGDYVLSFKVEVQGGISRMRRTVINQRDGTKEEYAFTLRAYSRQEMESLIGAAGLTILDVFGGFDKRAYSVDTPRMIILAAKG